MSSSTFRKNFLPVCIGLAVFGAYWTYKRNEPVRTAEYTSVTQGVFTFATKCANPSVTRKDATATMTVMGGSSKETTVDGIEMAFVSDRSVSFASVGRSPDKVKHNERGSLVFYSLNGENICQVAIAHPKETVTEKLISLAGVVSEGSTISQVGTTETGSDVYQIDYGDTGLSGLITVARRVSETGSETTILSSAKTQ
ncbi:hypothetical protein [Roseovarius rhodophyticola]|uniref:Uncharacterized protein n=1 Tax=Roseovarius rhodophyticola TaxID=3080827 RepID=A0ABZ2TIK7_9RHOB|nr:hypothetical protein [Roseovarius sp. W115]MDV2929864.1 hypothetical protein [Roseovarius sp. W115]